jgi:tetratricopeptide (TPR) repeat protein
MKKINFKISLVPNILLFFTTVVGTITLFWTIIEILEYFKVDLQYFKNIKWVSIYLIFLHGIVFGFVALYYQALQKLSNRQNHIETDSIDENNDSILVNDLIHSLKKALDSKHYHEVIRIGSALSKPFFLSGNYKVRLNIGHLVEEAAAAINDEERQAIELIDSIGWMYVELGNLDEGEKHIKHGLQLAKERKNYFYVSKAYRHLGAICRRRKNYESAEIYYLQSLEEAEKITEGSKKIEAIAGTNYAQTLLYFHRGNFIKAEEIIELAIKKFEEIKYYEKVNMSLITKADILFAIEKIPEAKDLYRKVMHLSETSSQRLQMVSSYIGLAKVYIKENDWIKAIEYLEKSERVEKELESASELSEINELWEKIPSKVLKNVKRK